MPRRPGAPGNAEGGAAPATGATTTSGTATAPAAATAAAASTKVTMEERLLEAVGKLYKDPSKLSSALGDVGLVEMSKEVGLNYLYPSKKVTVMIVGNHSAGKSSFVNWYVDREEVQSTGVAVESQGFTVITAGEREELVTADSAVQLKPYLAGMAKFEGCTAHLAVRVCTSRAREFLNVDIIDTPGLIDGSVSYPFDVNKIIVWLAQHVDLIFVFLDPVGQALCDRTMAVVSGLMAAKQGSKMHFYLTKADQVPNPTDLHKVITQTSLILAKHAHEQMHGFELQTIWLPDMYGTTNPRLDPASNCLGKLTKLVSSTVQRKVQANMTQLQERCDEFLGAADRQLQLEEVRRVQRRRWLMYRLCLGLLWCPLIVAVAFWDVLISWQESLPEAVLEAPAVTTFLHRSTPAWHLMTAQAAHWGLDSLLARFAAALVLFFICYFFKEFFVWRTRRTKVRNQAGLKRLSEYKQSVALIRKKTQDLVTEFLNNTQRPE